MIVALGGDVPKASNQRVSGRKLHALSARRNGCAERGRDQLGFELRAGKRARGPTVADIALDADPASYPGEFVGSAREPASVIRSKVTASPVVVER